MVVLVALTLTATLFAVGLAVDAGRLFDARRSAQAAADAGALAAAAVLYSGGSTASANSAAVSDATLNGFTNGSNSTTVAVSVPPTTGARAGDSRYAEVTITRQITTLLLPTQITSVRARAVGGVAPLDMQYAVIALDSGATNGALSVSANGSLTITGAGVMVNSSSSTGADNNSGTVSIPSGMSTDVVGGVGGTWPSVRTGRPVLPDPLANFTKPDTSGMTDRGNPSCCTLLPGVYTGTVTGNNAWTLTSGTYVFKGAGISLAGNSSLTGTEVFIFITNSSYPNSGGTCGSLSITGNNATTLTAPTSGTYDGMLLYQDPVCTAAISIGGNGAITATGTIYAPSATVVGNGNNAAIAVTQIVADEVHAGNADITLAYSAGNAASPRIPSLEE